MSPRATKWVSVRDCRADADVIAQILGRKAAKSGAKAGETGSKVCRQEVQRMRVSSKLMRGVASLRKMAMIVIMDLFRTSTSIPTESPSLGL